MQVNVKHFMVQVAGFCVVTIASLALLGYVVESPHYYTFPPRGTPMAFPTAALFVVIGLCLMVIGSNGGKK